MLPKKTRIPNIKQFIDLLFIGLCFLGMIGAIAKSIATIWTADFENAIVYMIYDAVFCYLSTIFAKNYKVKKEQRAREIIDGVYDELFDTDDDFDAIDLAIEKQNALLLLEDKACKEGKIGEKEYEEILDLRLAEINDLVDLSNNKIKENDYMDHFLKREKKMQEIQKKIEKRMITRK